MSVRPPPPRAGASRPRHGIRAASRAVGAAGGAAALLLAVGACGSGSDDGACGEEVEAPVDPQSAVHVLPGAPEAEDRPALPTSGIHVMNPSVDVVSSEPLAASVAVGVLERSGIVIEYSPDIPPDDRRSLEALATEDEGTVVVAPAPDLPSPIVARAWQTRLDCTDLDVGRLESFVDDHLGTGSAMDPTTAAD